MYEKSLSMETLAENIDIDNPKTIYSEKNEALNWWYRNEDIPQI